MSDVFFARIINDLEKKGRDPEALARLIRRKRELLHYGPLEVASEPTLRKLSVLLREIPKGIKCVCCGYEGLVHVKHTSEGPVGPECAEHPIGTCKQRRNML